MEFACGFNDFVQAVQNTDEYPSLQYQVMEVDLYLDDWWLVFEHQQTKELHSLIKMLLSGLWSLAVRLLEDERISSSVSLVAGVKIFVNDVSNVLVYKYNPFEKKKNNNCFIPTLKMFISESKKRITTVLFQH